MADISALHKSLTNQSEQLKSIHNINLGISKGIDKLVDLQIADKKQRYEEARKSLKDRQDQAKKTATTMSKPGGGMTGSKGGLVNDLFSSLGQIFSNLKAFDWGKWLLGAGVAYLFKEEIKTAIKAAFKNLGDGVDKWWKKVGDALDQLAIDITPQWMKDILFSKIDPETGVKIPSKISVLWDDFRVRLKNVGDWFASVDKSIGSWFGLGDGLIGTAWKTFSTWLGAVGKGFKKFAVSVGITDKEGNLTDGALLSISGGLLALVAMFGVKGVVAAPFKVMTLIGRVAFKSIWAALTSVGSMLFSFSAGLVATLAKVGIWGAAKGFGFMAHAAFLGLSHLEGLTKKGGLLSRGLSRLGLAAGSMASYLTGVNPWGSKSPGHPGRSTSAAKNVGQKIGKTSLRASFARGATGGILSIIGGPIALAIAGLAAVGTAGYFAYEGFKKTQAKRVEDQQARVDALDPAVVKKAREEAKVKLATEDKGGFLGYGSREAMLDPMGGKKGQAAIDHYYNVFAPEKGAALKTARQEDTAISKTQIQNLEDERIKEFQEYNEEVAELVRRQLGAGAVETRDKLKGFLGNMDWWPSKGKDGEAYINRFGKGHFKLSPGIRPEQFQEKLTAWLNDPKNLGKPITMDIARNNFGLELVKPEEFWDHERIGTSLAMRKWLKKDQMRLQAYGGDTTAQGTLLGALMRKQQMDPLTKQPVWDTSRLTREEFDAGLRSTGDKITQQKLEIAVQQAAAQRIAESGSGIVVNDDHSVRITGGGESSGGGSHPMVQKNIQQWLHAHRFRIIE